MVESGRKTHAMVESKYLLVIVLASLPITCQTAIGLAALASSWGILVFTWIVIVPSLQIMSGVFFVLVFILIWKAIFRNDREREEKLKAAYLCVYGLFVLNAIIAVACIGLIVATSIRPMGDAIKQLVHNYSLKPAEKQLLDEIQMRFYCCGGNDVTNWFYNDWQNVDIEPGHVVDISSAGWDAVPFSCCSREVPPPCLHEGLKGFGLGSVYSTGCASALTVASVIYLVVCLVLAIMAAGPLCYLRYFLREENDNHAGNSKPGKGHRKKGGNKKLGQDTGKSGNKQKTPRGQKKGKSKEDVGKQKKKDKAKPSGSRQRSEGQNLEEKEGSNSSGSSEETTASDTEGSFADPVIITAHGDYRRTASDPLLMDPILVPSLELSPPRIHSIHPSSPPKNH